MHPFLLDETYVLGLIGKGMTIAGIGVALVLAYILFKLLQPTPTATGGEHRSAFSIGCSLFFGLLLIFVLLFLFNIN